MKVQVHGFGLGSQQLRRFFAGPFRSWSFGTLKETKSEKLKWNLNVVVRFLSCEFSVEASGLRVKGLKSKFKIQL